MLRSIIDLEWSDVAANDDEIAYDDRKTCMARCEDVSNKLKTELKEIG